jgi:hypothetical protein
MLDPSIARQKLSILCHSGLFWEDNDLILERKPTLFDLILVRIAL